MFLATLRLAIRNLLLHKLRSILTLLGTILGVASVIAMLSIGEGSKREALEQIRRLGASNIIIRSVKPQPQAATSSSSNSSTSTSVLAYGLTFADLEAIRDLKLEDSVIVPSIIHQKNLHHAKQFKTAGRVIGTTNDLPAIKEMKIDGRFFSNEEIEQSANVVVVGDTVAYELFGMESPLEKPLLIGDDAFRVIGVVWPRDSGSATALARDTSDQNNDLYIPISSAHSRMGVVQRLVETGSRQYVRIELSEITIRLKSQDQVKPIASVIRSILLKRHTDKKDYEVQVPLELMNQAEREKRLWNLVLGSIAGISLLVGGIGIMNIMLATVTERTREIGIRRAIGAKRHHIIMQFLMETTVLSTCGGLLGMVLGVAIPIVFTSVLGIQTSTSVLSVVVAFGISVAIGIIFGVYPAHKAANMSPIEALRHQ